MTATLPKRRKRAEASVVQGVRVHLSRLARWREAAAERGTNLNDWIVTVLTEEIELVDAQRDEQREINSLKPKRRSNGSQEDQE